MSMMMRMRMRKLLIRDRSDLLPTGHEFMNPVINQGGTNFISPFLKKGIHCSPDQRGPRSKAKKELTKTPPMPGDIITLYKNSSNYPLGASCS